MEQSKQKSTYKIIMLIAFGLFGLYSAVGVAARAYLLDTSEPFPSWTYTSKSTLLNAWTSWDSGFYFDLAKDGYPEITKDVKTAYIEVPANRWVKVFLGGGLVGDKRFNLPTSTAFEKVNHVVFMAGKPFDPVRVPIFYAGEGIPYCRFDGPIDYDRDVATARESLTNSEACGGVPCNKTYVTYYSAEAQAVLYQEYFISDSLDPINTYGEKRPLGLVNNEYIGFGCNTVGVKDVQNSTNLDYKNQFTSFSFGLLYSGLSKALSFVVGDIVLSGLIVSFIFFVLSGVFLYKLASQFMSTKAAFLSVLSYLLFPFAFFNLAFLPISLFNCLLFASLYYAWTKKYFLSILLSALLVFVSYLGIFILIPLWVLYLGRKDLEAKQQPVVPYTVNAVLVFLALSINLAIVYAVTGDPFAFISSKIPWWGGAQSFIGGFITYFTQTRPYNFMELVTFAGVCGLMFALYYLKFFESKILKNLSLACGLMFVSMALLNGGLTGITKYFALMFPVFFYLGQASEKDSRIIKLVAIFGLLFGAIFMSLWTISSQLII